MKTLLNQESILMALRALIAATFILSAYSKWTAPGIFEIILVDQGFFSDRAMAAYFSRLLMGLELALGILYLQPYLLKRHVSPVTLLILTAFTGYLIYLAASGDKENCGCFGEIIKMSPLESILKNLFLIGLVLYVALKTEINNKRWYVPIIIVAISFASIFAMAPITEVKDFRFAQYTRFEKEGRVDLSNGDVILGVYNLDCEHCQAVASEMGRMVSQHPDSPKIYSLFYKEGETTVEIFNSMTHTNFPYHMIDVEEFFDLIGNQPPRIYWLRDGGIKRYWDDDFSRNFKDVLGNLNS